MMWSVPPAPPPRKRLRATPGMTLRLGTKDLDRLWNQTPDNLSCLRDGARGRPPPLREFLEPVVAAMDPEQGIDEAYKVRWPKGAACCGWVHVLGCSLGSCKCRLLARLGS